MKCHFFFLFFVKATSGTVLVQVCLICTFNDLNIIYCKNSLSPLSLSLSLSECMPTDTHELRHKHSYHPRHTFKSIIKSQIVRFYRICTHKIDFDRACTTLFSTLKRRGYSISFLKKVKRDTIFGLTTTGSSQKCSQSHCRTCQHIKETTTIVDNNSLPIGLSHNLNCKSSNVIYMIQCSNCNIKYVGETSRKLKDRINQHRSDINTYKLTPVAIHFTQTCPDISYFQVIPLEKVKEKEHNPEIWNDNHNLPLTGEETMIERLKIVKADQYHLLTREQYWIKRLKTLSPHGLNLRTEIAPHPHSFCNNIQWLCS